MTLMLPKTKLGIGNQSPQLIRCYPETLMRCPFCSANETRVTDSRLANEGNQVRRRRECTSCKERFTTYESAELNLPWVIKNDGNREPFTDGKLQAGILRALEKRPVDSKKIDALITRIKKFLLDLGERDVTSMRIGERVMQELRALDDVAYVRFASVYKSFQDVNEFKKVIDGLENAAKINEK